MRVIYPTRYRLHPHSLEVVCDPLPHPGQPLRRWLQARAIDEERRAVRIVVPERGDSETFEHYVARCLHEAFVARRLSELKLPAVPAMRPVLVEVPEGEETDTPGRKLKEAEFRLGPRLFELFPLSAQKPGENWMEDPAMQLAAPLWGIAIDAPPEGTRSLRETWEVPGLRLRDHRASALLHAAETVAWVYARAKEEDLLCLPADPSRIYLAGTNVVWVDPAYRVASLLEVHAERAELQGQRADVGKVSRGRLLEVSPWRFLPARFEAGLAQYAGEVLRAEREVPSRIADDVALRAFESFLRECLDRQWGFGRIGFERELYRGLQGVAGRALKGLGEGYSGWDDLLADLERLSDPDKRAPTPIRVGVFLDYANVFTSLHGWSIDMGKVARAFADPLSGRRVKCQRAVVVESPGRPKDRIQRKLNDWGFEVDSIDSGSGRADQKDDERLMQRIREAQGSLDEIVGRCDGLLTRWERSTQDFAGVVRTELASALKAQAETSAELLREIQEIAQGFESSLDEGVAIVRDAIVDQRRATEDLRDAVASSAAAQRELVELVPQARGAVEHAIDRYDQLAQQWHEDTRSFVETLRQEIENAKAAHRTALERWNDLEASIRSVGDELQGSLSALSARLDGLVDRWSPVVDDLRKVVGDLTSGFQGIAAAMENGRLAYAEASSRLQEASKHIEKAAEAFADKLSGSFDRSLHKSLDRFAGQLGTLIDMIAGGLSSVRQSVDEVRLAHETGVLAVLRLHQEDLNGVRQHLQRVTSAIEDSLARLGQPVEQHFPQIASVLQNLEAKIDRMTDHQADIRNGAQQLVQAASQLSGYTSDIALRVRSLAETLPQVSVRSQRPVLDDSGQDAVPGSGASRRPSPDDESTL